MVIDDYSELSYTLTKNISKSEKKKNGIYFTPPQTINDNLKFLEPYMENIKNVLEPSCGSCEYILALNKYNKNFKITGIEFNKTIFNSINNLENDSITLYNEDYLLYDTSIKYDLIIGNPPYFVIKKEDVDISYYNYFNGRPNIFVLFIIRSLKLLNKNGILSFVLPKNFLNCLYYDKTRSYISRNFKILNIIECNDSYIETKQDTIVINIQNIGDCENNKKYILNNNNYTIFGLPHTISKFKNLYNNSKTLLSLNFSVNVGNVVWNQCKDILTDDGKETKLIYSSDIKNNILSVSQFPKFIKNNSLGINKKKRKIIFKKKNNKGKDISPTSVINKGKDKEPEKIPNPKKNYIKMPGKNDPLLVINRGYGVGHYQFNYCLIDISKEFLIENHLIVIKFNEKIPRIDLINKYNKIIKSFKDPRTNEFIELYFGNNAINITELSEMLPIYDI